MTPEQEQKIAVLKAVLSRVIGSMEPEEDNGETIYRDGGNFILQLNEKDFERLQEGLDDLDTLTLEY